MKKLRNLFLLILCFCRFIFRGRADKPINLTKASLNILVIQLAKMGDMVCTTPVFRAIKNKYPNARVVVAGNAVNKELLEGNPDVSGYIVFRRDEFWKTLKEAREVNPDAVILTGPSPDALAFSYLSDAPLVVAPYIENGFCPHETRVYKILRHLAENRPHRMGNYAPREYLRLLEPLGIYSEDTTKHLRFNPHTTPSLREGGDILVGIAPGTGHKIKLWPSERFARLADEIRKKYNAKIVVIGGPEDRKEIEAMGEAPRDLSMNELRALISKLDLFISVDTGPIYIAEAFGVPTVCIVGPMDEREQPPRGAKHKVVIAPREKPELHIMNNAVFDYKEARRQVEDITVEMVMEKVKELLQ